MMKEKIHIWPNAAEIVDDQVICSAVIELPSGEKQSLWYRIPSQWASSLTDKADPYLIASIFGAMAKRADLYVHGKVSRSLLANLENYQSVWKTWKPDLWDVAEIFVDEELESGLASGKDSAILPFSGGVDCSFTAYRHTHNLAGRNTVKIGAGFLVHFCQDSTEKPITAELTTQKASNLLADLEIPLIEVLTNWRHLPFYKLVNWEDSHPTALIAVASLFQKVSQNA